MTESKSKSKSKPKSIVRKISSNSLNVFPDDVKKYPPQELLTKKDNSLTAQKIIERLSYLLPQHKEIFEKSKNLFMGKVSRRNFSKLGDLLELITMHGDLLSQCNIILTSAIFFQFTVDTMNALWLTNVTVKQEAKAIVLNSRAQYSKCSSILDYLQNLKIRKEILVDDVHYYRHLWNIHKTDEDKNMVQFEDEIWRILTCVPSDISIPPGLCEIDDELCENNVSTIENKVRTYISEGRVDENVGSIILLIGKRCLYLDAPKFSRKIVGIAKDMLLKFCDKDSIKMNILSMAEAFVSAYQHQYGDAVKITKETLENISQMENASAYQKEYLKFQLGYFLVKWNATDEGMALLEQTASFFQQNIGSTESLWRSNVNILAQLYNEQSKGILAYSHAEKVIRQYHIKAFGEISPKNKTICDVANELSSKSSASTLLMQTVSARLGPLPVFVTDSIREIVIYFAAKRNFNAVKVMEKYLNECLESYKTDRICEDEIDAGVNFRLTTTKNPQPVASSMDKIKRLIKK